MITHPVYPRLLRRETHSPRSVAAIVVAIVAILVGLYVATELVLALVEAPALLISPSDALLSLGGIDRVIPGALIAGGVLAALIGLALLILALLPGRRARHRLPSERLAVVVDNEVIASSLARTATTAGGISPDNATVTVSHRRALVEVQPPSGLPVDEAEITRAVEERLDSLEARPGIRSKVAVARHGKVGA
ncbi:DUF6286 domain-containing protein [Amnibacterium flavum]|uniref:DNA/RNA endonuclease G n=1 Tax=Amnibacterium flavum TaxID=2173173 RepID=A0A2V1HYQ7_9MICO|nr:DUF6286 domain-containing protein [Amnibacterium flavum]PVZ95987.1 DNA/RNA endonuclease G [Amnibacterium flavum]